MKQVPALTFAVLTMALTSTTVAAQQTPANQAQAATAAPALVKFEIRNDAIPASQGRCSVGSGSADRCSSGCCRDSLWR